MQVYLDITLGLTASVTDMSTTISTNHKTALKFLQVVYVVIGFISSCT
jgi:hypothetical protein